MDKDLEILKPCKIKLLIARLNMIPIAIPDEQSRKYVRATIKDVVRELESMLKGKGE